MEESWTHFVGELMFALTIPTARRAILSWANLPVDMFFITAIDGFRLAFALKQNITEHKALIANFYRGISRVDWISDLKEGCLIWANTSLGTQVHTLCGD